MKARAVRKGTGRKVIGKGRLVRKPVPRKMDRFDRELKRRNSMRRGPLV